MVRSIAALLDHGSLPASVQVKGGFRTLRRIVRRPASAGPCRTLADWWLIFPMPPGPGEGPGYRLPAACRDGPPRVRNRPSRPAGAVFRAFRCRYALLRASGTAGADRMDRAARQGRSGTAEEKQQGENAGGVRGQGRGAPLATGFPARYRMGLGQSGPRPDRASALRRQAACRGRALPGHAVTCGASRGRACAPPVSRRG